MSWSFRELEQRLKIKTFIHGSCSLSEKFVNKSKLKKEKFKINMD